MTISEEGTVNPRTEDGLLREALIRIFSLDSNPGVVVTRATPEHLADEVISELTAMGALDAVRAASFPGESFDREGHGCDWPGCRGECHTDKKCPCHPQPPVADLDVERLRGVLWNMVTPIREWRDAGMETNRLAELIAQEYAARLTAIPALDTEKDAVYETELGVFIDRVPVSPKEPEPGLAARPALIEHLKLLRRVAAAAQNSWVGRNWPDTAVMRRNGLGIDFNDREKGAAIRRHLYEFQPEFMRDVLGDVLAALRADQPPSKGTHRVKGAAQ